MLTVISRANLQLPFLPTANIHTRLNLKPRQRPTRWNDSPQKYHKYSPQLTGRTPSFDLTSHHLGEELVFNKGRLVVSHR